LEGHESPTPRRLATWQVVTLVSAVVVSLVGAGLMAYAWSTSDVTAPQSTPGGDANLGDYGAGGFMPGEPGYDPEAVPGEAEAGEPRAVDEFSPAIFRLGFSFVIGFAVAYALRTFVKISVIAIGVFALALFGLQYAGVIEVNWNAMGGHFDSAKGYIASQTASFKDFMTGSLPSAASATAGLVVGFRKR
jgi:uncharacterized membrane protein (Fun14 family)